MIYYNIILYIFSILLAFYIIFVGYSKIRLKFWKSQPVFHCYNLFYWLSPPGIINFNLSPANKYLNILKIKTYGLSTIQEVKLDSFCNFIKNYYMNLTGSEYKPSKKALISSLSGCNNECYLSFYEEPKIIFDQGTPDSLRTSSIEYSTQASKIIEEICGVITAKPLTIIFNKKNRKTGYYETLNKYRFYYVDNLCVHPGYRNKGLAPELIQTHYYNLRLNNKSIVSCLFKREGKLNAIVPLTTFDSIIYDISSLQTDLNKNILNSSYNIIEINKDKLGLVMQFIKEQKKLFECLVLPDITNIASMVECDLLVIYGVVVGAELVMLYIFNNNNYYYNEKKSCDLIGSINSFIKKDNDIFITCFYDVLDKLKEKIKNEIIIIENNSHNNYLINSFVKNNVKLLFSSPCAYFCYNYASHSIKSENCLVLT